ncbi:uncharacterized protein LOC144379040 [Halichoerus grypus]
MHPPPVLWEDISLSFDHVPKMEKKEELRQLDPCCVSLSMHDQFAVIYGKLPPQEFEACGKCTENTNSSRGLPTRGMTLMVEFQESREASEDETSKQQRFLNTLGCLGHK